MRTSGILLPITALPSPYGIGTLGKAAFDFIDFLKAAGQKNWQILPVGPISYGDSPYQSFSSFAGNPYFIDLDLLAQQGFLHANDYQNYNWCHSDTYVDYDKIFDSRFIVLRKAFSTAFPNIKEQVEQFRKENSHWIEDYALYMAVKFHFGQRALQTWDTDIKLRQPQAMEKYKKLLQEDVDFWACLQYWFFEQWNALRSYANKNEVKIIGDVPIYVALDSADVWANMDIFELDDAKNPIEVAGCPPDAFSEDGQLWGNPLYNWQALKEQNYAWWIARVKACATLYDTVRIDHFRGFAGYYAIPFGDTTARNGKWKQGPDYALFEAIKNALGEIDIIAEDLGFLTPDVVELVEKTGYPGMKILQFAFDSREESDYLPHNYTPNTVVYTGTHDNDTMTGWLATVPKEDLAFACKYLNVNADTLTTFDFIRAIYASVSNLAIAQMQDFLAVGSEGRMNIPSTIGSNWKWRVQKEQLSTELADKIANLVTLYSR